MAGSVPPPHLPTRVPAQLNLGLRALYMIVFALVFWILCWTLAVTAVLQLILTLLAGRPNADLVHFGAGLGAYARQVIEFLTFVSDRIPFPFSEWPNPAGPMQ